MNTNPDFRQEFADLYWHIGSEVGGRLDDFERRLRGLLVLLEKNNTRVTPDLPNVSDEDLKNWLKRLSFVIDNSYQGDAEQFISEAVASQIDVKYIDLLIVNDDVLLTDDGLPTLTDSRPSIAQDVKHMIRETGLLVELVAERDGEKRQLNYNRIIRNVDEDERIIPGTAAINEADNNRLWLTAKTVDYHQIGFYL